MKEAFKPSFFLCLRNTLMEEQSSRLLKFEETQGALNKECLFIASVYSSIPKVNCLFKQGAFTFITVIGK